MIDDVHISSNKHTKLATPKKKAAENQQVVYVISCRRGRAGSWSLVFAYLSSCCAESVVVVVVAGVCVCYVCDIHLKIPLDATPITTRGSNRGSSRCEANLISGSVKHTNCS